MQYLVSGQNLSFSLSHYYITNFYWDEIGCITMVDNCNGINHGYTLLYKPKTPIVTMGSEKDCCLSKSGPHHI